MSKLPSKLLIQEGYNALVENNAVLAALAGAGALAGSKAFGLLARTGQVGDNNPYIAGPLMRRYIRKGVFGARDRVERTGADLTRDEFDKLRSQLSVNALNRDKALAAVIGAAAVPALAYAGYKHLKKRRRSKKQRTITLPF